MNDDANFPRRTGRAMIAVAVIGALALMTFGFDTLLERQINPNSDPASRSESGFNEVVLDANRQNHYVATAQINGHDAVVMLDTGATQIAVAEGLAERLGLPKGAPLQVSTANGLAMVWATELRSVRLGSIELRDVRATIVPNMDSPDVLLGMNFLADLEMTQRDGRLILRQSRANGNQL